MTSLYTLLDVFISILNVVPFTIGLAILILLAGLFTGISISLCKKSQFCLWRVIASVYTSFARGVPLIVQLFLFYYALPRLIVSVGGWFSITVDENAISPVWSVFVTLTFFSGAILAENIRGSLSAVDRGQYEAALAIGLTPFQAFFRIVLPQALKISMPYICNTYILIVKGLSLAFTVAVVDILAQAKLCSALNFRYIESYLAAAIMYWVICNLVTWLFEVFNKRVFRFAEAW